MVAKKSKKKKAWLSSTVVVLLTVLVLAVIVGVWYKGWRWVMDGSLVYVIGASFTALLIIVVGLVLNKRKKLRLW